MCKIKNIIFKGYIKVNKAGRKMRINANWALAGALLLSGGTVYFVHYSQQKERDRMRKGPERDVRRRKQKLMQNNNNSSEEN